MLSRTDCRSIGPGTVKRGRLYYPSAVAESWKEQLANAFVSVACKRMWFWTDREIPESKPRLNASTARCSFLDHTGRQSAPVLTIPTN